MNATPPGPVIRVMLVDDHPMMREGLRACMEVTPDLQVVAEAGDEATALALAAEHAPTVVVMDIGMRDVCGIDLAAQLLKRHPGLLVLMLSMYDSAEHAQRAMAAGARGYVLKDASSDDILAAVRTVAGGGTYLSASLAQRLFRAPTPRVLLSQREQEILALLGRGQSSKQIARALDVSVRTVESHRQSIKRKLDLPGQAELIRYAVEHRVRSG